MKDKSCVKCKHWEAIDELAITGTCHRFPPVPSATTSEKAKEYLQWTHEFPRIHGHNWCGEWSKNKNKKGVE